MIRERGGGLVPADAVRHSDTSFDMKHGAPPIDVFISYKREDWETAKALAEALAHRGYSVWWDVDLLPGELFADAIMEVIKRAKATLVLWSEASVASGFVRAEATAADGLARLIPARLDACELPLPFNILHTHDLTRWRAGDGETLLAPLFRAIETRTGKAPTAPQQPAAAAENLHRQDNETLYWRSITEQSSPPPRELELFLARFPDGIFADLARIRLNALADGREVPLSDSPDPGWLSKLAALTKQTFLGRLVRPIAGAGCLALIGSFLQALLSPEAAVVIAFPLVLLLGAVLGALPATLMFALYMFFNFPGADPVFRFYYYNFDYFLPAFLGGGIVVGYLADRGWCRTIRSSLAAFGIGASLAFLLLAALLLLITDRLSDIGDMLLTILLSSSVLIILAAAAIGWMNSRKAT